jgi:uncharacterized membrane protein YphA (DoxX/SURF4 family)
MQRLKIAATWLLQLLMALAMTGSGVQKFTSPAWERMFRVWGYPDHFYLVIGAVEAVCGIALLVPKAASPAALALMVVMAGAAVTQMTHGRSGVGELVFFTVLGVIAFARRRYWIRTSQRVPATT